MDKIESELKLSVTRNGSKLINSCKWRINGIVKFISSIFDLNELISRLGSVLSSNDLVIYKSTDSIHLGRIHNLKGDIHDIVCNGCIFSESGIICDDVAPCYFYKIDDEVAIDVSEYYKIDKLDIKFSLFIMSFIRNDMAKLIIKEKE